MKIVRDISVTSALMGGAAASAPWNDAWSSPTTETTPALVLDFAANCYGAGGTQSNLSAMVALNRPSVATHFDAAGQIASLGAHAHRLTHDPVAYSRLGMLVEPDGTNLVTNSDVPSNQTISVGAVEHVLSFYGGGTVTVSGAHSQQIVGTGAFPNRTQLNFTPASGSLVVDISGDVQALQIEEGSTASSYIPSLVSATLREEERATVDLGLWFSAAEGTLVFSGHLDGALANDRIIELDSGSTSTRLSLLWNTVLGKPQFQIWEQGALQAAIAPPGNSIGFGVPFRIAIGYSTNDFAVALNGGSPATDTSGNVPAGLTTLRLGRSIWGGQSHLMTESVVYYPTRLSNDELQALSA